MKTFVAVAVLLSAVCLDLSNTASIKNHELLRELFKVEDHLMANILSENEHEESKRMLLSGVPKLNDEVDIDQDPSLELSQDLVLEGLKEDLQSRQRMFKQKIEEIIQQINDNSFTHANEYLGRLVAEIGMGKKIMAHALGAMTEIHKKASDVLVDFEQMMQKIQDETTGGLENIVNGPVNDLVDTGDQPDGQLGDITASPPEETTNNQPAENTVDLPEGNTDGPLAEGNTDSPLEVNTDGPEETTGGPQAEETTGGPSAEENTDGPEETTGGPPAEENTDGPEETTAGPPAEETTDESTVRKLEEIQRELKLLELLKKLEKLDSR